jgi:hypothetical protein
MSTNDKLVANLDFPKLFRLAWFLLNDLWLLNSMMQRRDKEMHHAMNCEIHGKKKLFT